MTVVTKPSSEKVQKQINYKNGSLMRIGILVGLIFVVSLIVYITPMPEEYFESCDRPCHELDWPMICRVKLTLEVYKTLSKSCKSCPGNTRDCDQAHCVTADGHSRGILAANRLLPGPSIQVCENDIMVIDVVNRVPGQGVTIHWRGQPQVETPFMDGVPMITQCPIPSYTTFQYKFRASAPGTHLYHAHAGSEASDGLFGAFVVRQAPKIDPHKALYDFDNNEHVMVISEWSHGFAIQSILDTIPLSVKSILVNGKGSNSKKYANENDGSMDSPLSIFNVTSGKRYRFRIAHAGGVKGCPITLSIENHRIQLIALDGHPTVPQELSSLILGRGERADFVLNANKPIGSYRINVSTVENCESPVYSAALLKYEECIDTETVTIEEGSTEGVIYPETTETSTSVTEESELNTVTGANCVDKKTLCVSEVQSLTQLPQQLTEEEMQTTIYLPYYYKKSDQHPNTGLAQTDGFTFTFPSSPLLTQGDDVSALAICSKQKCRNRARCDCVHIKKVSRGNTVELILVDQGGDSEHTFHLHGYSFFVVATNQFSESLDTETIMRMNSEDELFPNKNLVNPVEKDTITIPKFGAVAVRFKADNPGYWILRDENSNQWTRGLDVVLQVGERSDFVKAPPEFPRCGSYVGPHYFLI